MVGVVGYYQWRPGGDGHPTGGGGGGGWGGRLTESTIGGGGWGWGWRL